MMKQLPSFADAHKAIRGGKDPRAFLHLGILYALGIGTTQDEMLAQYFIRKALDMGCKEAEEYLDLGYESGSKVTMFAVGNAAELYPGSTLRGCEPLAVRHSLGVFHRSGCAL